jgi:signal transduction histidine kinase/HAMP domain-containing protein
MSGPVTPMRKWRFRTKLRMAMFAVCLFSVLIITVGLFLFEKVSHGEHLKGLLNLKADLISEYSRNALTSGDSSGAALILSSLASQPHVISAALYDKSGHLLAPYVRSGDEHTFRASPDSAGVRFEDDALVLSKEITAGSSRLGTISISMDLIEADGRLWGYGKLALLLIVAAMGISYFIALPLEKHLSGPIVSLAETARKITKELDYSLRAPLLSGDETGLLASSFNQMLDTIERREGDILASEKRYRSTLDNMMEGCQLIGFDWRYLYINDVAARQGRRTPPELLGRTMMQMYPGIEDTPLFMHLRRCMDERVPYGLENEFVYPDNSTGWFNLSIQPVPEGIFILSEDITRVKQLVAELTQHREHLEVLVDERTRQLEAANKELEAFSYSVSHDLRAPLRHVSGFVDLLEKTAGESLSPLCTRYLDMIASSASDMGQLIDDLLSFSRMGRTEMLKTSVDMGRAVNKIVRELATQYEGRTIGWEISELPTVEGDLSMLRQVWRNLLSNSIKYTRPRNDARVHIGADRSNGEFVFSVRDNGVGFNASYVHKLFGVFQRLHSARDFEGTGIGLANVRRIVERHGGRVWAQGAEGEGATFFFTLPLTEGHNP